MYWNSFPLFLAAILCIWLAAYIFIKETRSPVQIIFTIGMLFLGLKETCIGLALQSSNITDLIFWERCSIILSSFLPATWLLFSVVFARSNYKELLNNWKWFVGLSFLLPFSLVTIFTKDIYQLESVINNITISGIPLGWSGKAFYFLYLLISIFIIVNLEGTLRASTGTKRWYIKFMILGVGCIFVIQIYTVSQILLFSNIKLLIQIVHSYVIVFSNILIMISLSRDRRLKTDIYLSHNFLYKSVTGLIAGLFLLSVGIVTRVIVFLGGNEIIPMGTLFVFVSILIFTVITLSDQIRLHIRRFVINNFYKPQYDYRKEWTEFTKRTASIVDIKILCNAISMMISETFNVPSVSILLIEEKNGDVILGGSTAFSENQWVNMGSVDKGLRSLVRFMNGKDDPVDLEDLLDENELKIIYSDFIKTVRIRYCVSLVAGNTVIGLMILSERLKKEPFSLEDFDLLKTITDQSAGNILNIHLSDQILKAKEMEAFQTLSTFFVHDMKNLASTLSLTMQNLPDHYDNPEFRKDTLQVISRSVNKINVLCNNLSIMTKKIYLNLQENDLNEIIMLTLNEMNGSIKSVIFKYLNKIPIITVDFNQIKKVIINMILNANDATDKKGEIRITTDYNEDWVILSFNDNGCGMAEEFISKSLFKPFQTTKSEGLGIGLFHCKKIIESHYGKIEVESEEGVGTTFKVFLPLCQKNGTKT